MAASRRVTPTFTLSLSLMTSLFCLLPRAVGQLPECSVAKTNESCALLIERGNPVAPPTIQMYSGERITVVLQNPNSFERYFLDYTSGQAALKPDVASSIVQGLLPSLQKIGEFKALGFGDKTKPLPDVCVVISKLPTVTPGKDVDDLVGMADICLGQLAENAIDIYQKLEPYVAPDSLTPGGTVRLNKDCKLADCIGTLLDSETAFSARITLVSKDPALANAKNATFESDSEDLVKIAAKQKTADSIAADLQGYKQRLADLPSGAKLADWGFRACDRFIKMKKNKKEGGSAPPCIAIQSRVDAANIYRDMVTRTITYTLNAYNLVSYPQEASPDPTKKKALATILVNFADNPKSVNSALRWEASAGAFFSSLPVRSFAAAPVFTAGVITDKKIAQNILHPTVVPFAAGNYRLTNDLPWSRWKSNLYWTGAVGINPNTVTADFATGLSLSWRALMVSGLCHFGHDVRLTQGLTVGESLGAGFNGSIPTQTYWTESFAIGLSIRVPSLTGR
jgi:hypothetical protein